MRNQDELLRDLIEMEPLNWNTSLAEEFNFDFETMIEAMNEFNYIQPTEDTIHTAMLTPREIARHRQKTNMIEEPIDDDSTFEVPEELVKDVPSVMKIIGNVRRDICNYEFGGDVQFNGLMIFGIIFDSCDFSNIHVDDCIFNNCTFKDCDFSEIVMNSSKIIDCEFVSCDFSEAELIKVTSHGNIYNSCDFDDSNSYEVLSHLSAYIGCDFEAARLLACSLQRTTFLNCPSKRIKLIENVISGSDMGNCDFRKSRWIGNTIMSLVVDQCHLDASMQYDNKILTLSASSDIADFFVDNYGEETDEGDDDDDGDETPEFPGFEPPTLGANLSD